MALQYNRNRERMNFINISISMIHLHHNEFMGTLEHQVPRFFPLPSFSMTMYSTVRKVKTRNCLWLQRLKRDSQQMQLHWQTRVDELSGI